MSVRSGARPVAGTALLTPSATHPRRRAGELPPIGPAAFVAVAVASLGGPLALAALSAPGLVADTAGSGGLATVAALAVFGVPLAIWLRYAAHISSAGGLYAFVEAAAGRAVALAQAAVWTVSYLLYLVYTTVQIVYDVLPAVVPAERSVQTPLALLIPLALVAVMVAGRGATLVALGVLAAGQLALTGILDGVAVAHLGAPVSAFGAGAPAGAFAKATVGSSLLYVCGSLPLFLGGEVVRPARTVRRGLIGAVAVTGLAVVLAVVPLAAAPGVARTEVPGVSLVAQFAGAGLAEAVGIGVAASIGAVMLCEYLALTRLVHAVAAVPLRTGAAVLGAVVLAAAPLTLLDPHGVYDALLEPSLVALWISQLIVFAVYPRFARRMGLRMLPACGLAIGACALAGYGIWTAIQQSTT